MIVHFGFSAQGAISESFMDFENLALWYLGSRSRVELIKRKVKDVQHCDDV